MSSSPWSSRSRLGIDEPLLNLFLEQLLPGRLGNDRPAAARGATRSAGRGTPASPRFGQFDSTRLTAWLVSSPTGRPTAVPFTSFEGPSGISRSANCAADWASSRDTPLVTFPATTACASKSASRCATVASRAVPVRGTSSTTTIPAPDGTLAGSLPVKLQGFASASSRLGPGGFDRSQPKTDRPARYPQFVGQPRGQGQAHPAVTLRRRRHWHEDQRRSSRDGARPRRTSRPPSRLRRSRARRTAASSKSITGGGARREGSGVWTSVAALISPAPVAAVFTVHLARPKRPGVTGQLGRA